MAVKKGIVFFVIGLMIGTGIFLYIQHKTQVKIKEENRELKERIKKDQEFIDAQARDYVALKKEAEKERKERDQRIEEANEAIAELEEEKTLIIRERDEYKSRIEVADPNYIVNEIGKRIGMGNIVFKAAGVYELTREGANRVLFQFVDGESSERNYQKQIEITAETNKKYEEEKAKRINLEELLKKADELITLQAKQIADQWRMIEGLEKELAAKKRATLLQQGIAGGVGFLLGSVIN